MTTQPIISVILPTCNRRDLLLRCLEHLCRQSVLSFEVILVDDGSTDGTSEAVEGMIVPFGLTVLRQQNRGPAAARNAGAARARGRFLLMMDDDLMSTPDLIREHLSAQERWPESVVFGPIPISEDSVDSALVDYQRRLWQTDIERINRWGLELRDASVSANTSLSREMFLHSGGYDESLHSEGDELELGARLAEQGIPFRWNPAAVARQLWVKSVASFSLAGQRRRALNEAAILKRRPAFRSMSRLSGLFLGPFLTVRKRRLMARFPAVLNVLGRFFQVAARLPAGRLRRHLEIAAIRAASAAAFWKFFRTECGNPMQFAPLFDRRIVILMYHLVRDDRKSCDVILGTRRFERQIRYLHENGYTAVTISDWVDWVIHGKALPARSVILTFDDGFLDVYENAWPILKKFGFRFTVFLVTDRIGTVNAWQGVEPGGFPLASVDQIREMADAGVEFQAHSGTHPDLTTLETPDLVREVQSCLPFLESTVGHGPRYFAYPYGVYGARERKAAWEAGYAAACTVDQGRNDLTTDLFRLKRINIAGTDSLPDFILKTRLGAGVFSRAYLKETIKAILRGELGLLSSETR